MDYGAWPCLNWKEILSLTDDYYQVNSFLAENNILIAKNFILPKLLYCYLIRLHLTKRCQREEREDGDHKATVGWRSHKSELSRLCTESAKESRRLSVRSLHAGREVNHAEPSSVMHVRRMKTGQDRTLPCMCACYMHAGQGMVREGVG